MTAMIETRRLTRRFGGLIAVDGVSMSVARGEIRGLIGPNGAGKTTLLNLIGGQVRPSSGSIMFHGVDATGVRADRLAARGIRRTFQNVKLFRAMTILENVMVGLHANGRAGVLSALLRMPRQRAEESGLQDQAWRALELVGLGEQAHAPAASLAYGHRRLLEIARSVACRPQLLLLDEPAAGLNATEAAGLVRLIHRINADGITIILVEHRMEVVMTACARITVLNYGRLLAEGSPGEIARNRDVIEAYLGRGCAIHREAGHA